MVKKRNKSHKRYISRHTNYVITNKLREEYIRTRNETNQFIKQTQQETYKTHYNFRKESNHA